MESKQQAEQGAWQREVLALAVTLLAVFAVYCPWRVWSGREALLGSDHLHLHARRMAFAREALFGPQHDLPAWYPRELMGTPFRANLQNFPLIPTRLIAFALFEPLPAFGASVVLSAMLAAAFTYLLCRRYQLSIPASAAAGWTFACSGFFAARVLAGHLPLLEAYPALPALLYLADRAVRTSSRRRSDLALIALAVAGACFALVGHPQISVYSFAVAALYACVRAPRIVVAARALAALALGAGLASFALVPMASLAGRSTRVLGLERAANDIALPYSRIGALLFPWKDGWPVHVQREPQVPFEGYANTAYFWDTVSYVGWAPWLALAGLAVAFALRRVHVARAATFFVLTGALALAAALPWLKALLDDLPGTLLRSPSRLLYVVGFCLALALAAGLDRLGAALRRTRLPARARAAFVASILVAHVLDLGAHARAFVSTLPADSLTPHRALLDETRARVGDGRMGIDYDLSTPLNRMLDDAGVFDSLLLARPYRFVLDTSGAREGFNEQVLIAGQYAPRTLRACGVRFVWTGVQRSDLRLAADVGGHKRVYDVDEPQPRADFVPGSRVRIVEEAELRRLLRDPSFALDQHVLVDAAWGAELDLGAAPAGQVADARVSYARPSSDVIELEVECGEPGVVRVLETWDPGWSATLDGARVEVVPAHDTFLGVGVAPGRHALRFEYHTPGAALGLGLSLASVLLLALLSRRPPSVG